MLNLIKLLLEMSGDSVGLQVVSGQLEGTMFDMKAARKLEEEEEDQRQGKPVQRDTKEDAREAAVAARTASRVLQSLPSKVSGTPL